MTQFRIPKKQLLRIAVIINAVPQTLSKTHSARVKKQRPVIHFKFAAAVFLLLLTLRVKKSALLRLQQNDILY
jgi:hypothetical protein